LLIDSWRPQEAITLLRPFIARGSDDSFAYHLLGDAFVQSGATPGTSEESEAIRALLKAIQLRPDFAPPRLNLAKLYLQRGENEKALPELQRVIQLDPGSTAAYNLCAQIYREQDRLAEADQMLKIVNRLNAEKRSNESKLSATLSELRTVLTRALDH
jgi:predicted Zn-dependent protease